MGKKPRVPVLIATKRAAELEDTKWTEKIFTGDNS